MTDTRGEAIAAPSSTYRFAFTGTANAYFRIWAVSLALSLLTLGIYSAWGKVRKRRYLYAHTRLAGSGFDYRASPIAILKGRIIALALFGGFAAASRFSPVLQLGFILILLLLTPWIVVASSRFNARNTAWRNVTFGFDGGLAEAAKVLLGFGALAVVTFGLAFPYFRMRRARFLIERHRFGATPLHADLLAGGFIVAYLLAFLMLIGAGVIYGIAAAITVAVSGGAKASEVAPIAVFGPLAALYAAYIVVYAYVRARIGNLTLNGTIVGPLRCRSTLRARDLAWLYVTNIVAIIATLGLATPWVTIRMARYRAAQLALEGEADLETLAARSAPAGTATGSEVGDLFDVEVSL
jgi:uncharacterized membrane protein YjgN (DUF898 family)